MKRNFTRFFITCVMTLLILSFVKAQEPPSYKAIAEKIVNSALKVKPGEVVVINGYEGTMTLMHELYVAVSVAGGKPVLQMNLPLATKEALMEAPIEYLQTPNDYTLMQIRAADCFVNLNTTQDPNLFDDVPEERMTANRQAMMALDDARGRAHYRSVSLGQVGGIPTFSYAQSVKADHYEMLDMFWKAIDADYGELTKTAKRIKKYMKKGANVKVVTSTGTNITFKLADVGSRMNCGTTQETDTTSGPAITWLPAGEVYSAIDPKSAEGMLVIPRTEYRGKTYTNLRMFFKEGRLQGMKANEDTSEMEASFEAGKGDKDVLSAFDIGVNPYSRPIGGYLSYEMAGVVTFGIGNNTWTGGDVNSDFVIDFQLANATVGIDGTSVVRGGKIQPNL